MQNCSQCGADLAKNAKYCAICLTPVNQQFSFTTLPDPIKKKAELLEAAKSANQEFLNPQKNQTSSHLHTANPNPSHTHAQASQAVINQPQQNLGPRIVTAIPAQEIIKNPSPIHALPPLKNPSIPFPNLANQPVSQPPFPNLANQPVSQPPFPNLANQPVSQSPSLPTPQLTSQLPNQASPNSIVFPNQSKFESQANFPNQPLFNKNPLPSTPKLQDQLSQTIQLTQPVTTSFIKDATVSNTAQFPNVLTNQQGIASAQHHIDSSDRIKASPLKALKEPRVQQAPYLPSKNQPKPKAIKMDQDGFILVGSAHSDELPIQEITQQIEAHGESQNQSKNQHLQTRQYAHLEPIKTTLPSIFQNLFQLDPLPKIFLFGFQHIQHSRSHEQPILELCRKLILCLEERELLTFRMEEADLFISYEHPPQSWIEALIEYQKNTEQLLIWYPSLNHQSQNQTKATKLYFGEYGLLEIFKLIHFIYLLDLKEIDQSEIEKKWKEELIYFTKINLLNYFILQLNQPHFEQKYLNQSMRQLEKIAQGEVHQAWFDLCRQFQALEQLFLAQALDFQVIYQSIDRIKNIEVLNRIKALASRLQNPQRLAVYSSTPLTTAINRLLETCQFEVKRYSQAKNLLQALLTESFTALLVVETVEELIPLELIKEVYQKHSPLKIVLTSPLVDYQSFMMPIYAHLDLCLPHDQFAFQLAKVLLKAKEHSPFSILGKYIDMIQLAQQEQQQHIFFTLLLISFDQRITQVVIELVDRLRQQYLPKSLAPIKLDEAHLSLICTELSIESFDLFYEALAQYFNPTPWLVGIQSQENRQASFVIADALLRLELLKQNQQKKHFCFYELAGFSGLITPRENTLDLVDTFGVQIYIVDDQQHDFYALKQACEAEGFIVSVAQEPSVMLSLLPQLTYIPQLLIINCEGKQAFELLSFMKKNYPKIKVLMSAKHEIPRMMRESFDRGADDFLSKPFSVEESINRIFKALYLHKN